MRATWASKVAQATELPACSFRAWAAKVPERGTWAANVAREYGPSVYETLAASIVREAGRPGVQATQPSVTQGRYQADAEHKVNTRQQRQKRQQLSLRRQRDQQSAEQWQRDQAADAVESTRNAEFDADVHSGTGCRAQSLVAVKKPRHDARAQEPVELTSRELYAAVQEVKLQLTWQPQTYAAGNSTLIRPEQLGPSLSGLISSAAQNQSQEHIAADTVAMEQRMNRQTRIKPAAMNSDTLIGHYDSPEASHVGDERFWKGTAKVFRDISQPVGWPAETEDRLALRHQSQLLSLLTGKTGSDAQVSQLTSQRPPRPSAVPESARQPGDSSLLSNPSSNAVSHQANEYLTVGDLHELRVVVPSHVQNTPRLGNVSSFVNSPDTANSLALSRPHAPRHMKNAYQRQSETSNAMQTPQRSQFTSHLDPTVPEFHPAPREKRKPDSEESAWRKHVLIDPDSCGQCGGDFVCFDDGITFNCGTCRAKRPEAPLVPIQEHQ